MPPAPSANPPGARAPIEGLRVIDLTEALAGPYCTMLLGDLGADVIKIERPGAGDQSRQWGAVRPDGMRAYFASTNRNKRSLTLDLKQPAAQDVMQRLLATADVLVCNVPRLASLERLGLHPDSVLAAHPRLIYCAISGYGHTGPSAGLGGYDLVAQGEAGLMSVTGTEQSAPIRYPIPLADMSTGLYSALAILAALLARHTTGAGQFIDMSLLESQATWVTILAGDYFATGKPPRPIGNDHPSIVPYQVFQAADKAMIIAVGTDKQWAAFCGLLGLGPEVRDDTRFASNPARVANRGELIPILQDRVSAHPVAHWLPLLRTAEIPCGPINTVPDLLADPHYTARGNLIQFGDLTTLATPLKLGGTPPAYRLPPPQLGQHTQQILAELGYEPADVQAIVS
jgi:crotonobetainyl-CoA:carnitine CoA-transferase CaiB-like acyl-CoA transferase